MTLGAFVLVVVLIRGYGGGVGAAVAIDMPDQVACDKAAAAAKQNHSVAEAFCLPRSPAESR